MNSLMKCFNRSLILSTGRTSTFTPLERFLSVTNVVCDSQFNVISRKLGIPERPKKPLTAYFRFMEEVRPSIKKTVKTAREVPPIVAAQWKKLDDGQKQKYMREFELEKVNYLKKKAAYEKSLTKEQKLAIKDEQIRLKELKADRASKQELKARLNELGKPKRPSSAFLLFLSDELAKGKANPQSVKAKYNALDESQKNVYKQKSNALMAEYRKALQTWEKQMIAKGLTDVVSKTKATKLSKLK